METQLTRVERHIDKAFWALVRLQGAAAETEMATAVDDLGAAIAWLAKWEESMAGLRVGQTPLKPDRLGTHLIPF
jgi:hypothetical protein